MVRGRASGPRIEGFARESTRLLYASPAPGCNPARRHEVVYGAALTENLMAIRYATHVLATDPASGAPAGIV